MNLTRFLQEEPEYHDIQLVVVGNITRISIDYAQKSSPETGSGSWKL